ncbi:MAG: helix-turn-helix domain-containing protein, partial [Muribaculaceae bacterium]|nr:helix-turn-helix domain-containing protein [Muribaculaceae bacterium]
IRVRPQISLSEQQFERIMRMVAIIKKRREEPTEFSGRIVNTLIQVLLFELMDVYLSSAPGNEAMMERGDVVFMRFLSILSQNFRREREVAYYANVLNLTPRYFATIIRNKSGVSPINWIARFVIAESKALLDRPDMSIKEIAATLNFSNQSFFGRYFKQHTGMAPGRYRRNKELS